MKLSCRKLSVVRFETRLVSADARFGHAAQDKVQATCTCRDFIDRARGSSRHLFSEVRTECSMQLNAKFPCS